MTLSILGVALLLQLSVFELAANQSSAHRQLGQRWPTEVHRHPPVRATARGFLFLHPASSMRQHQGQHEGQQQKHVLHRCFLRLRQALWLLKSLLLFRRQQKRHRRQQRQQCQQRWRMRGAQLFVGCCGSPKVGVDACSPKSGIKVAGRNGSVGRYHVDTKAIFHAAVQPTFSN